MIDDQRLTILHNPRCSKSRAALQLLHEHGHQPRVVEYLITPPSSEELDQILRRLRLEPRDLMRRQEPDYRKLGLDDPTLDRGALIDAMVRHPTLIERPIVLVAGKAVVGRPPERVMDLL
jgi:arsenate reductase